MNRRPRLLAALAGMVLLAGCGGYDTTVVPEPEAPPSAAPAAPSTCVNDGRQLRSFEPGSGVGQSATIREIRASDKLVAGVAGDTYLLGSRNPETNQLEGFDIDLAEAIGEEIFGEPGHVEYRVITAADRVPLLQDGTIDIVARNMTINCSRWEQIAFSAVYYEAGQSLLVGEGSGIDSVEDLAGRRVCASAGTTTIDNIRAKAPEAEIVTAPDNSRCMVRFQNGEADAVTSDDTVLAGLAAQDPYAEVLSAVRLSTEPYGIGVSADRPDLARLVNKVLEDMRTDGRWQASYDAWLKAPLENVPGVQPTPLYGRR
ncbi:glutamate ABC transporter substrate-binding protein [Nocardioides sp. 1609]|uniref:glutamate ABC transporter substrate-binding protein n=1 Tax=Nocardioides sp. 1609 TaxID=2508327 RepID=UPI001FD6973D|nr:glutamate ABC transporter substrate-binding protein [Nocardioides sp. 1609]